MVPVLNLVLFDICIKRKVEEKKRGYIGTFKNPTLAKKTASTQKQFSYPHLVPRILFSPAFFV